MSSHKLDKKKKLYVDILPQPDDITCGPTCLHAIYRYFSDELPLDQVISEIKTFKTGGTLAVFLGQHALKRGFQAKIYTYNLEIFDPSWFESEEANLSSLLKKQLEFKNKKKLQEATYGYLEFLNLGGTIKYEELTSNLIMKYLDRSVPILTGLSATYLYNSKRERSEGKRMIYDDLQGEPSGHFVILCGYDQFSKDILIADPFLPNPYSEDHYYQVKMNRVISSILLGILTYDANLLIIEK